MALNGAYENKKVRRLSRSLEMPPWAGLGMLEAFWAWARRAARTGRIDPDQWDDLAEYLQWQTPSEGLRQLLIGNGFVDEMGGWDCIHHWDQHADDNLRRSLEKHGETFSNGSAPRKWRKQSSLEVPLNHEKVPPLEKIIPPNTRAGPEPEPEPEPEPRTTKRAAAVATVSSSPPLSTENFGHPEFEAYREALHSIMAQGVDPPDDAIVARVIFAARGAPVEALSERLRQFAKTRHGPPKSYGFWPDVVADWFKAARRSGKRNHS